MAPPDDARDHHEPDDDRTVVADQDLADLLADLDGSGDDPGDDPLSDPPSEQDDHTVAEHPLDDDRTLPADVDPLGTGTARSSDAAVGSGADRADGDPWIRPGSDAAAPERRGPDEASPPAAARSDDFGAPPGWSDEPAARPVREAPLDEAPERPDVGVSVDDEVGSDPTDHTVPAPTGHPGTDPAPAPVDDEDDDIEPRWRPPVRTRNAVVEGRDWTMPVWLLPLLAAIVVVAVLLLVLG